MIPVTFEESQRALDALIACTVGPIFLPANLRTYGLGGDSPRAVRLWRNADWTAFIGLTNSGVLMPQLRDASAADLDALPHALAGPPINGMNGELDQIGTTVQALGLQDAATTLDRAEPCFALNLSDLIIPGPDDVTLRAPLRDDVPLLQSWRTAYRHEILGDTLDQARDNAAREVPMWLAEDALRLAIRDGQPVALAGFNARLPGLVQIGGVYTPPALRRQGLARRAVALLLSEAAASGVTRSVLFAASDNAARAYTAIGFQPAGRMRMIVYPQALTVVP